MLAKICVITMEPVLPHVPLKNVDTINELAHGPKLVGEIIKYFLGRRSILELGRPLFDQHWHSDEIIRNADLAELNTTPRVMMSKQAKRQKAVSLAAWQQRQRAWIYSSRNKILLKNHRFSQIISHEEDRRVLLAGIKISRRLMILKL